MKLFEYDRFGNELRFLPEVKALMEQFSTPGTVDAYFIESMVGATPDTKGQAMTDAFVAGLRVESEPVWNLLEYTDNVFINDLLIGSNPPIGLGGFTGTEHVLAHEILHLPGSQGHVPEKTNLMSRELLKWNDSAGDQKRLTKAQEDGVFSQRWLYIELEE